MFKFCEFCSQGQIQNVRINRKKSKSARREIRVPSSSQQIHINDVRLRLTRTGLSDQ